MHGFEVFKFHTVIANYNRSRARIVRRENNTGGRFILMRQADSKLDKNGFNYFSTELI
jgi:hypothetical protein